MTFPREARLVRRGEFDAVYRAGRRRSSGHFTVFLRANALPHSRFGFSIKKALGNAVVRNRIRRRVREIVRCNQGEIPAGWDIVIHPKSAVARASFAGLRAESFGFDPVPERFAAHEGGPVSTSTEGRPQASGARP